MELDLTSISDKLCCHLGFKPFVNYILDRQGVIKDKNWVERILSLHISRIYIRSKHLVGSNLTVTKVRRFISCCRELFIDNEIPVGYNELPKDMEPPKLIEPKDFLSVRTPRKIFELDFELKSNLKTDFQKEVIKELLEADYYKLAADDSVIAYSKDGKIKPVPVSEVKYAVRFNALISREDIYNLYCSIILYYRNRWRKKYGLLNEVSFNIYLENGENTRNYHVFNFLRELAGLKFRPYKRMRILKMFSEMIDIPKFTKQLLKKRVLFTNFIWTKKSEKLLKKIEDTKREYEGEKELCEELKKERTKIGRELKGEKKRLSKSMWGASEYKSNLIRNVDKLGAEYAKLEDERSSLITEMRTKELEIMDMKYNSGNIEGYLKNYTAALDWTRNRIPHDLLNEIQYHNLTLKKARIRQSKRKRPLEKSTSKRADLRRYELQSCDPKPFELKKFDYSYDDSKKGVTKLKRRVQKFKKTLAKARDKPSVVNIDGLEQDTASLCELLNIPPFVKWGDLLRDIPNSVTPNFGIETTGNSLSDFEKLLEDLETYIGK